MGESLLAFGEKSVLLRKQNVAQIKKEMVNSYTYNNTTES